MNFGRVYVTGTLMTQKGYPKKSKKNILIRGKTFTKRMEKIGLDGIKIILPSQDSALLMMTER